jgi:hypothetical protein
MAMNKFLIFLSILIAAQTNSFAQKIIRSSLSSFGNSTSANGATYRQTIGQPSNITVVSNNGTNLRQGFQQPASSSKSNTHKQKVCTLYLMPNPASDFVHIKFLEDIGKIKFQFMMCLENYNIE